MSEQKHNLHVNITSMAMVQNCDVISQMQHRWNLC